MDHQTPPQQPKALRTSPLHKGFCISAGRGWLLVLIAGLCLVATVSVRAEAHRPSPAQTGASAAGASRMTAGYGRIPLSFQPNQGQSDPRVQYLSRGPGFSLFLTPDEVLLSLERPSGAPASVGQTQAAAQVDTLSMKMAGSNPAAVVSSTDPQSGVVNYLIGNDRSKWHTNIPTFGKVSYSQIYPGVDLVFYGNQRQLEYDFVVAPGADAGQIAWQIDGAGASVDADGNLVLAAAHGPASFKAPVVYQMDGQKRMPVEGRFAVAGNRIHFKLGSYDHSKQLIIDPVLSYASYLSGSSTDNIGMNTGFYPSGINNISQGAAVDPLGSLYVTGYTYSPDFPTTSGSYQETGPTRTSNRYPWAFVTKVSPNGNSLAYSTYLGGSVWDYAAAIAVDSSGDAYVTGYTASPDFPVTAGAFQTLCGQSWTNTTPPVPAAGCPGLQSAFVTKLNPAGNDLIYSTFLDGYGNTEGVGIAVDSTGRAYVTGNAGVTCASYQPAWACFPTTSTAIISGSAPGGYSPPFAYVSVFDPTGSRVLYSTLFGDLNGVGPPAVNGSGPTYATAIAVDPKNNFYVTFNVDGLAVPTTAGVIQPKPNGINTTYNVSDGVRGFIAKFTPVASAGGSTLSYGTYLGGGQALADSTSGIAVDANGNAYVGGLTQSYDFPVTADSYQPTCGEGAPNACNTAYVVKLNPTASEIVWGTFLGDIYGGAYQGPVEQVGPVQLDRNGNVYITGQSSLGFPLVNPVEAVTGANAQAFVSEFDPTGTELLFSSLIGSGGLSAYPSYSAGMAIGGSGNIFLAGVTGTGLITTSGSFEPTEPTVNDYHGFVAKIAPSDGSSVSLTASPSPATYGLPVTLTATVLGKGIASTPTGTVTFNNGTTELGTGTLSGGVATYQTTSLAHATYNLTASYGGDESFGSSVSPAHSLTVNRATPTITWTTPAAIPYGTAVSATQEDAAANVPGSFVYSQPIGWKPGLGLHTLSVTFTPTDSNDYKTATASVTLTVNTATPTITWATPAAIKYGTALGATQLDAKASVAGTFVYSPAAGTVLAAGSQTLSVTFTPTNTTDYTSATATVTLTVNPVVPPVTWASPAPITYGTALSAAQLDATSTVAGTFVYLPAAGKVLTAGTHTLWVTFTPYNTTDYKTAMVSVTLTVNPAP